MPDFNLIKNFSLITQNHEIKIIEVANKNYNKEKSTKRFKARVKNR